MKITPGSLQRMLPGFKRYSLIQDDCVSNRLINIAHPNLPQAQMQESTVQFKIKIQMPCKTWLCCADRVVHKKRLLHYLDSHIASCISHYPPSRPGTATTSTNLAMFFTRPPNHPAGSNLGSTSRFRGALSHRVWLSMVLRAVSSSNLLESFIRMLSRKCISSIEAKIGL